MSNPDGARTSGYARILGGLLERRSSRAQECLRFLRFYAYIRILTSSLLVPAKVSISYKPPATTGSSQSTNLAVLRAHSCRRSLEHSAVLHAVSFFTRHQSLRPSCSCRSSRSPKDDDSEVRAPLEARSWPP